MRKKILFTLYLMFFGVIASQAQQDYIVLHQADTIRGKYLYKNNINKFILMRNQTGKIKIPSKDVKFIIWKNRKYAIKQDPCVGGLNAYRVFVEGKVTLLNSGGIEDYCPDLVVINDVIYPITRQNHFSQEAWEIMSTCTNFHEKYKDYYNENREKRIIWEWAYRKSRNIFLKWLFITTRIAENKSVKNQ